MKDARIQPRGLTSCGGGPVGACLQAKGRQSRPAGFQRAWKAGCQKGLGILPGSWRHLSRAWPAPTSSYPPWRRHVDKAGAALNPRAARLGGAGYPATSGSRRAAGTGSAGSPLAWAALAWSAPPGRWTICAGRARGRRRRRSGGCRRRWRWASRTPSRCCSTVVAVAGEPGWWPITTRRTIRSPACRAPWCPPSITTAPK